jgi:Ca-activated chloride channel family protein
MPAPAAPGGGRWGRPGARPAHRLDSVRPQLTAELDRLRALPAPDLLYLADLGTRLAALAAFLGGNEDLETLARELEGAERPGADAQALHERAVEVLTALTGGGSSPSPAPGPAGGQRRGPFWKRA